MDLLDAVVPIFMFSTLPGALGGVGTFLFSVKKGHYKNNKYFIKFTIEIFGAMLFASFFGPLFPEKALILSSFCIGLSWAALVQVVRSKITKVVQVIIGENLH
jgi:hypothetical protein